jgi:retron-type reverse transcriptase
MRRVGYLWDRLTAFDNLLAAARRSARGKRFRPAVLAYHVRLEDELFELQDQLRGHTWTPGPFHDFYITHPKRRLIHAAPYRDRVVHHALVGVLEPIFEKTFIADSFASRKGKGTHAGMRRCQEFARRYRWAWKADIRHFFPSIDHQVLQARLARKIKDPDVLWLAGRIIAHSPPPDDPVGLGSADLPGGPRRRGLPIGNQTSQFFANVYLDPLDHFVKEHLRLAFVRYVDDFVLFADDKRPLQQARARVAEVLAGLRLRLHPTKDAVFPVRQGIRFLGYRVWPTHVKLAPDNVYRFRRRLRRLSDRYHRHQIEWPEAARRILSWWGHAGQADTWRLRWRLLDEILYRRASAG